MKKKYGIVRRKKHKTQVPLFSTWREYAILKLSPFFVKEVRADNVAFLRTASISEVIRVVVDMAVSAHSKIDLIMRSVDTDLCKELHSILTGDSK